LAICFASSSISCSSGIYDDNQQKSRSDIEQCWGIFAISSLFPWSTICCYLTGHERCKSQAVQTSRFSAARVSMDTCGMSYIKGFGNVVCNYNFVICTIKLHTHVH
jgi:hypothetical protein